MPRVLSSAALQAAYAQQTADGFLILIHISHPALSSDIYVTSDIVPTVSQGITYAPFPFDVTLPDDDPDKPPTASLTIDAIDRSIIAAIRSMGVTPATLTIDIVTMSTPDVVEMTSGAMTLRNVTYDALTVTGQMSYEEILQEPFPGDDVSPLTLPGVYLVA